MSPLQLIPEWLPVLWATVPNFAIGVVILVFRTRIRLFIKKLVPRMGEDAEFWTSRVILIGGLFLMAMPVLLAYAWISSAATRT